MSLTLEAQLYFAPIQRTDEENEAATRYIERVAIDDADRTELLAMLGLIEEEEAPEPPAPKWDGRVCKHGHRLTPDNIRKSGDGKTRCKECHNAGNRRRWDRSYKDSKTCSKGHVYEEVGYKVKSNGARQCNRCISDRWGSRQKI